MKMIGVALKLKKLQRENVIVKNAQLKMNLIINNELNGVIVERGLSLDE
jgi:hypothetical protein